MKKSTPKKTIKSAKKAVKKTTRPAVKSTVKNHPTKPQNTNSTLGTFQTLLWLSIIFSSILIIISKL